VEIEIAALTIGADEPCYSLGEYNISIPQKGKRRVQVVRVMRGDKITTFRRDLGDAKKFKAEEFLLMGGGKDEVTGRIWVEHNVGEFTDAANRLRERGAEQKETLDFLKQFRDYYQNLEKAKKSVSTFGHGRSIIRGG